MVGRQIEEIYRFLQSTVYKCNEKEITTKLESSDKQRESSKLDAVKTSRYLLFVILLYLPRLLFALELNQNLIAADQTHLLQDVLIRCSDPEVCEEVFSRCIQPKIL